MFVFRSSLFEFETLWISVISVLNQALSHQLCKQCVEWRGTKNKPVASFFKTFPTFDHFSMIATHKLGNTN